MFGESILERVRHVFVWVIAECCRFGIACTIARAIAAVGTEEDIGQCVGLPLQSQVSVQVVVARKVLRLAVGECAMILAIEVFTCVLVLIVGIAVGPAHTAVYPQFLAVIVV